MVYNYGGYPDGRLKHQFDLGCLSSAFGKPMPDGKYLSEKMILRSISIRVQDCPQSSCFSQNHANGCSIRRSCVTGLEDLVRLIASEMDVRVVMEHYECYDATHVQSCACAVRMISMSRQRRRKPCRCTRNVNIRLTEVTSWIHGHGV